MAGRASWRSLAVVLAVLGAAATTAGEAAQVPCYFVFGDSLVDNGNNNGIVSLARANYPPYGVDFAGGPTGRFSNGLTTVDVISKLLGFDDFIPPFAGATSDQLLTGVNFASAAAGIREETGQQLGGRISFSGQVQNYQSAVEQLRLVGMVDQFNRLLPGAHFTYINIDGIFSDILRAPGGHGLKVTNRGCCGVGRNNGQVTCLPFQTPCPNRNEYLFWDAFHPTEAANVLVGQRAYVARLASDVHPVDLRTLARL
uniref:GDSL esterase/lipase n=1 Tax=Aegilops tauschii TaxID=37682 RepID=R7W499_AEGTA